MPLPTTQTQSLAEALALQMESCRKIMQRHTLSNLPVSTLDIGLSLRRANAAFASNDQVAMLRSYQELKDHE